MAFCINLLLALLAAATYLDSLLQYTVPMTQAFCINLLPVLLAAAPYLDSLLQYAVPMTHGLPYKLTTCPTCRYTLPEPLL